MLKHVTYTFEDDDEYALHPRHMVEIRGFVERYRLPHEVLDQKAINHTDEQKADPHYRGWRSLARLDGNAFMKADVVAFLAYWQVIESRARERLKELKDERERVPGDHTPSIKAYDGMIDSIASSIVRVRTLVRGFEDGVFAAMAAATESDRHG